jgi:hypothetical protein
MTALRLIATVAVAWLALCAAVVIIWVWACSLIDD